MRTVDVRSAGWIAARDCGMMPGPMGDIFQAYAATTFTAITPRGELRLRVGKHHHALDALLGDYDTEVWAYITAYNPASDQKSHEDNDAAQERLLAEIAVTHQHWFEGAGIPDDSSWLPERSVLVLGMGEEQAITLGARYGQVAIVTGQRGEPARLMACLPLRPECQPGRACDLP